MSKTYELSYTAERIDEMLKEVDEHTIYSDATTEEHGLMSTTDKAKLDALQTAQEIDDTFNTKVDKEAGKGLSKNDYTDAEKESVASAYHKPQNGIPKTDLDSGIQTSLNKANTALQSETDPTVPSWAKQQNKPSYDYSEIGNTPDLSGFITKSVNDLTNYYLKSETYTKAEVAALIGAIQQFHYEIYATLPQTGQGNVLYLIGPTGSGADRYEEYVYANNAFTKIGDTSIDLSGYVTTSALNTALADYTTTSNLTVLLSNKADKVRNATNGNFAGLDANGNLTDSGKKATDFATASQGSKADNAILFVEQDALTDQQRNTALANVSNQTANSTTGKMGYKVLDPTKTFVEQVTAENTIYEIRDVFDLGGTQETLVSVTIPENTVLRFCGGMIKNGTLNGKVTIDSPAYHILDNIDIDIRGVSVSPEWFGVIADGITDCSDIIQHIINLGASVKFGKGEYLLNNIIDFAPGTMIEGDYYNTTLITNGLRIKEYGVLYNLRIKPVDRTADTKLIQICSDFTTTNVNDVGIRIERLKIDTGKSPIAAEENNNVTIFYIQTGGNTSNVGIFNVLIKDIVHTGCVKRGVLIKALESTTGVDSVWLTEFNFVDCFFYAPEVAIETVKESTQQNWCFSGFNFTRVMAQSRQNYTIGFARLEGIRKFSFNCCCAYDSAVAGNYSPFFLKDNKGTLSIVNYIDYIEPYKLIASQDGRSWEEIWRDNCDDVPLYITQKKRTFINGGVRSSITVPQGIIRKLPTATLCKFNPSSGTKYNGFILVTDEYDTTTYRENFIGFSDSGFPYFSKNTAQGNNFEFNQLYGRNSFPHSNTLPDVNKYNITGVIQFYPKLNCIVYMLYNTSDYNRYWYDPDGVVIQKNSTSYGATARRGTTATREAMNLNANASGFRFYDTDLNLWVYWNGSAWKKMDGTSLS